jgi:hypothetical protein
MTGIYRLQQMLTRHLRMPRHSDKPVGKTIIVRSVPGRYLASSCQDTGPVRLGR